MEQGTVRMSVPSDRLDPTGHSQYLPTLTNERYATD